MIWFKNQDCMIILLILLWCSVRVQTCSNSSTTQVSIKVNSYTDNSTAYIPSDIVIDSSMNKYLIYSYSGSNQDVHVSRINSDGNIAWSKKYEGFIIKDFMKTARISSNGDSLMMIGQDMNSP